MTLTNNFQEGGIVVQSGGQLQRSARERRSLGWWSANGGKITVFAGGTTKLAHHGQHRRNRGEYSAVRRGGEPYETSAAAARRKRYRGGNAGGTTINAGAARKGFHGEVGTASQT